MMERSLRENGSARNSNIEALRILSMLTIVAHHYAAFGFSSEALALSRNKLFVDLLGMHVRTGVDLFVLITGYYSVKSRLRLKKILTVLGSVWYYSLGMLAFFGLTGLLPIGYEEGREAVLPFLMGEYWFASYYVLLLLLSPFLNILADGLDRKSHAALCLLLFTLCTVLPSLLGVSFAAGMLPLFAALYLCGAYLRLYMPEGAGRTGRRSLILALALLLLCVVRLSFVDLAGQRDGDLARLENALSFMGVYSPWAFLLAVLLLLAACGREPRHNCYVNRIGGLCFGVYLFHANPLFSALVWQGVFHTAACTDSPLLPLHALFTVAALFAAGCLIELLRQKTLAPLWDRALDAVLPDLERAFSRTGALLLRAADKLVGREEE